MSSSFDLNLDDDVAEDLFEATGAELESPGRILQSVQSIEDYYGWLKFMLKKTYGPR